MTTRQMTLIAALGIAAWTLLLVALSARWAALIGWPLAVFGAQYAVFLRLRGASADSRAPFVAAALIVVSELAFFAVRRSQGRVERAVVVRSAFALVGAAACATIVGGIVLVAAGSIRSGLALEAVAVAAAVAAVGAMLVVAARTREPT